MNVNFYNNSSDSRKLSKSLSSLGSADCQLKDDCSVERPYLIVARKTLSNYALCNYMYIPKFRRYYFVEITALAGDMVGIQGNVDVLMTYSNAIRSLYCTVLRQENLYNDYLIDNQLPIRQTKTIQYVSIGKYNAGVGRYLTVDGGGGDA